MKLFTIIPIMLFFSGLAFAQSADDIVGDWVWSGNGCRDNNLSAESHISTSADLSGGAFASAILTFNADSSISFSAVISTPDEGDQRRTGSGTYSVEGSTVSITVTGHESDGAVPMKLVDGELVGKDDDATEKGLCDSNPVYVRVFSKVSS